MARFDDDELSYDGLSRPAHTDIETGLADPPADRPARTLARSDAQRISCSEPLSRPVVPARRGDRDRPVGRVRDAEPTALHPVRPHVGLGPAQKANRGIAAW